MRRRARAAASRAMPLPGDEHRRDRAGDPRLGPPRQEHELAERRSERDSRRGERGSAARAFGRGSVDERVGSHIIGARRRPRPIAATAIEETSRPMHAAGTERHARAVGAPAEGDVGVVMRGFECGVSTADPGVARNRRVLPDAALDVRGSLASVPTPWRSDRGRRTRSRLALGGRRRCGRGPRAATLARDRRARHDEPLHYNHIVLAESDDFRTMYFVVDVRTTSSRASIAAGHSRWIDYTRTMMAGFLVRGADQEL